jgi:hypothetical protein
VIPSEVTTALKAVTSAFGGAGAPAPSEAATGSTAPDPVPDAVQQAAQQPAIPRQPGPPEIAAQPQDQQALQPELAADPEQPVPAGGTSPGSLNGSGPLSGEDG